MERKFPHLCFGSLAHGCRLARRASILAAIMCGPWKTCGSGGLMDDERLLHSDGMWHRLQRKRVAFESSCYYTQEPELPHGCQLDTPKTPDWRNHPVRALERSVLGAFFYATGGAGWRTSDNWLDGDPCWDAWYGVTCDEHGYVIALELPDNRLEGSLPASIGSLKSLLKLDLSTTAANYHNHPNLHANNLQGAMPSLAPMSRLEEIEIAGNAITELPSDLYANAPSLRLLSASRNRIRLLPRYMSLFAELHTLELEHNMIEQFIPSDFGALVSMRFVQLAYNKLVGNIPWQIASMSRILVFDVSHNPGLTGEIPQDIIAQWKENEYLSILNTSISGYISALCMDVPFCWRYMYDTHTDLTWATAQNVPDIVDLTIGLALTNSGAPGPATDSR